MDLIPPSHLPQFFTATIYQWNHLLANDKHKDIIMDSLRFLVDEHRIELNAFVIMSSHIHLIWIPQEGHSPLNIQSSFLKFTARALKNELLENRPDSLEDFKVKKFDREYQVWKRDSLSVEMVTMKMLWQKIKYIHQNPVKAGLCKSPEDYFYSSARFYHDRSNDFGMLTNISGI